MPTRSLDFNINASGQAQLIERFDCLCCRLHDVDQPLMRADLELLAGFLVDMRTRLYRVSLDTRRQGNRPMHNRASPLRRIDNLGRALIQNRVIVRFHPDSNYFTSMTSHGSPPGNSPANLPNNSLSPPVRRETTDRIIVVQ